MTLGIGLGNWKKIGSLDRELAIYDYFIAKGGSVTIFTYDKASNILPFNNRKIDVRTKIPRFLPARLYWLYALLMPFLFYKDGKKLNILKTNQAHSGWPAVLCGKLWRKRVIARCGYVFGESAETQNLKGFYVYRKRLLEKLTFKYSDICFIPSAHLKKWVIKNYKIAPSKIRLMPNNVDADIFKPSNKQKSNQIPNIIAVGRLADAKRFDLLIASIANENWTLGIIGDGPLRKGLEDQARQKNVRLNIIGNVPNEIIPIYLNQADVFVICSIWEGHPKALLEAMSCGCVCIGTNTNGIREIINDRDNGLLCSSDPNVINEAIKTVLSNECLRKRIGENARSYVVDHFSSSIVFEKELKEINRLTCRSNSMAF